MNACELSSGSLMPQIGLGTGTFLDNENEVKAAVLECLNSGYRHIDGGFAYQNETLIGEALKEAFDSGIITREDLFYTGKLPSNGHQRERVKHFLELSLKRLGLEYLDLYLIHFPVSTQPDENDDNVWPKDSEGSILFDDTIDMLDTWKGMEDCVEAGLVKNIGLSNFNSEQIMHIYDNAQIKPANIQMECHIYLQEKELVDLCKELCMTFTAFSALGSPGTPSYFQNFGMDFPLPVNVLDEPLLKEFGDKYEKTPAQVALRFLVQQGLIVVPKSASPDHISENAMIFDFALDDDEMEVLRGLDNGTRFYSFDFLKGVKESERYPFK